MTRKPPPHAWTPGQSGNPSGRPKKLPEVRTRIGEGLTDVVELFLKVVRDENREIRDRVTAGKVLLEWGLPKPAPEREDDADARALEALAESLKIELSPPPPVLPDD